VAPDDASASETRTFVTGEAADEYAPVVNGWSLNVLNDQPEAPIGCFSMGRRVTFEFVADDIEEQYVLTLPGTPPVYDDRARVVSPSVPVQFDLAEPPQCFSLRLTDSAGNAKDLPAFCFESPDGTEHPDMRDDALEQDGEATEASSAGCRLPEGPLPNRHWLSLLAVLVVIGARRRRLSPGCSACKP
jgi:hypothetical protein